MPIPKIIYQTYKTEKLPLITQWHIYRMKKKNPDYAYEFYTDERIDDFIHSEFGSELSSLNKRIQIGAVKADLFRYAILFKKGGIYLDIDSQIVKPLNTLILESDSAIISRESHPEFYLQWALFYESGHPFLEKTLENVIDNLRHNRFPNDGHRMTGPTVYSQSIHQCLLKDATIPHRVFGIDYNGYLKFSYPMSKLFLNTKNEHWKKKQLTHPILKP